MDIEDKLFQKMKTKIYLEQEIDEMLTEKYSDVYNFFLEKKNLCMIEIK